MRILRIIHGKAQKDKVKSELILKMIGIQLFEAIFTKSKINLVWAYRKDEQKKVKDHKKRRLQKQLMEVFEENVRK